MKRLYLSAGLVLALAVLATAAFGATSHRSATKTTAASGSITFDGIWSGAEATAFGDVIKAFNKTNPNVHVNYKSLGDNLPTILGTAVAGGRPPDMADIAQPGLIQQFANKGSLKTIGFAKAALAANFSPAWLKLDTFNGKLYGFVFKASNKSTVWYNVHAFKNAGVTAPATFTKLIKNAGTIKSSGVPPFSIGGSDGWTLTDLFENIYLRQAGVAKYNLLSTHKLKWTDASVAAALKSMAQVIGTSANIAGGTSGALQTQFPDSVNNVFQNPPKAAIVIEGDFVPGVATVKAKPKTDYGEFPFPSVNGSDPAVEIGGDSIVAFKDNPAIEAFTKFLATPQAAAAWAKHGGFATGNRNMSPSVYPDAITRLTAGAVATAKNVVFDMSDEQPGSFGATVGQGEWGLFQTFLRNPKDVSGIQKKLEASAAAAYKKGK